MPRSNVVRCAALSLLLLAACASDDTDPLGLRSSDVLFLAQSVPPNIVMEALYQGRVSVDSAGCVRLEWDDQHTVVWPYGFTLHERGNELWVRGPNGRDVGRLGGSFRFGGGEVPTLHPGIALVADARQRALANCPGRYWIVGDVP